MSIESDDDRQHVTFLLGCTSPNWLSSFAVTNSMSDSVQLLATVLVQPSADVLQLVLEFAVDECEGAVPFDGLDHGGELMFGDVICGQDHIMCADCWDARTSVQCASCLEQLCTECDHPTFVCSLCNTQQVRCALCTDCLGCNSPDHRYCAACVDHLPECSWCQQYGCLALETFECECCNQVCCNECRADVTCYECDAAPDACNNCTNNVVFCHCGFYLCDDHNVRDEDEGEQCEGCGQLPVIN